MSLKTLELPASITFLVGSVDVYKEGDSSLGTVTLVQQDPEALSLAYQTPVFIQTEEATVNGVAVDPYGAFTMNSSVTSDPEIVITAKINDTVYVSESTDLSELSPLDEIELTAASDSDSDSEP